MTATTPETTVETLPYKNPDLPASERIADLLSRMTLEEKVGQMMQLDARGGDLDELIVNKHVGSILHTSPEDLPRAVETVNTKTRLGIPLVIGDDCIHGYNLPPSLQTGKESGSELLPEGNASFNTLVNSYERELIVEALKRNNGNMSAAARDLGLSPRVIHYKIGRLGITPEWYVNNASETRS